jgi:hypothetical protein
MICVQGGAIVQLSSGNPVVIRILGVVRIARGHRLHATRKVQVRQLLLVKDYIVMRLLFHLLSIVDIWPLANLITPNPPPFQHQSSMKVS